ncbi:methyl-accepting chemotaxis protein [Peptostreptococcaceae bacterium AGR-M142]
MKKNIFSIRLKLLVVFVIISLLTTTTLGISQYYKSKSILKANLQEMSSTLLDKTEESILNYLYTFGLLTELYTENNHVKLSNIDETERNQLLKQFEDIIKKESNILAIYFGTTDSNMYIKPDTDLPDGYDPVQRGWYKQAISENSLIWTQPYVDAFTGLMVVTIAKPVYDDNNQLLGVLGIDLALQTLSENLNKMKIGKTGYPFLVSSDGIVMTHKDEAQINKTIPIESLAKEINAKDSGFIEYVYEEKTKYAIFDTIKGLGWKIVVTIEESEIEADLFSVLNNILIISFISLIIGFVIFILFANTITKNIKIMLNKMEDIKNGNLNTKFNIKSKDELGVLSSYFEDTLVELSKLVLNIKNVSTSLLDASQNLASVSEETSASAEIVAKSIDEISIGAQDQAKDAENSAKTSQELAFKFNTLKDNTIQMLESAKEASNVNSSSIASIEDLTSKTKLNIDANENIEKIINELNEKTQKIGGILDAISAISVQTNLLALNASIEAARAGEYGKGFAVVAEEIRKLAEESSNAADEVRDIVINIQEDSKKTVESMVNMKNISIEQSNAVKEVNSSFDIISKSIATITTQINNVNDNVLLLIKDKENIVESIENISAISEETAAASESVNHSINQQTIAIENVANSAGNLNNIAYELNEEIKKFEI